MNCQNFNRSGSAPDQTDPMNDHGARAPRPSKNPTNTHRGPSPRTDGCRPLRSRADTSVPRAAKKFDIHVRSRDHVAPATQQSRFANSCPCKRIRKHRRNESTFWPEGLLEHQLGPIKIEVSETLLGANVTHRKATDLGVKNKAALKIGAKQFGNEFDRPVRTLALECSS